MIDKAKLRLAIGLIAEGSRPKTAAVLLHMPPSTLKRWLARVRDSGGDLESACVPRKLGRPRKS